MANEVNRASTSFIGYFIISLFLLILGVIGLQDGGLFGEVDYTKEITSSTLPLDWITVATFCGIIAATLTIFTVYSYRTGKKNDFSIFMLFSVFIWTYTFLGIGRVMLLADYGDDSRVSSSWFALVIFAVFFILLGISLYLEGKNRLTVILVLDTAAMTVFMALAYFLLYANGVGGIGSSDLKTLSIIFGILALIGFALAAYIGFAKGLTKKKIPMV